MKIRRIEILKTWTVDNLEIKEFESANNEKS